MGIGAGIDEGFVTVIPAHQVGRRAVGGVDFENGGLALLLSDGVTIDDPASAEVSYPTFWSDLALLTDGASGSAGPAT